MQSTSILIAAGIAFLLSCTAHAQEGTIQSDTLYMGHTRNTVSSAPGDTGRWDKRYIYLGLTLHQITHVRHDAGKANFGIGLDLRVPLLRFGDEGEWFFRPGASTGFVYTMVEAATGIHFSRHFLVAAGYAWASFPEDMQYEEGKFRINALLLAAGWGTGSFFGEARAYIPVQSETYHGTIPFVNSNGYPDRHTYDVTFAPRVSFGIQLNWYF